MGDHFSGRGRRERVRRGRQRTPGSAVAVAAAALLFALGVSSSSGPAGARTGRPPRPPDALGITPGRIKHVWLIILENKSYDATFTGLNQNTYLWRTLPARGALLKNYYGTGHSSFDNYLSLVSGQAPQPDSQADCPYYKYFGGHVDLSGSRRSNPNYGQMVSDQGPYGKVGTNGCVYPPDVLTLFNQFDAAHISWKGYAQDLGIPDPPGSGPTHDAGVGYCGAPYVAPAQAGAKVALQPNPRSANAQDQYLPKHFPFPWFASLLPVRHHTSSADCNAQYIASLFDPNHGLAHDLRRASTTPAFSWITPNMCSDGHDAVCWGNNLSGGFHKHKPWLPQNKPQNWTGGLYAADIFLRHVVGEIKRSPAYKAGGLIDITFDEALPPFTYSHNSFANSKLVPPNAATSIANDSAGETLNGVTVRREPAGPNTPLAVGPGTADTYRYPGPGNNNEVDRPAQCVPQTYPSLAAAQCLLGAGKHPPGPRNDDKATARAGTSTISDNSIVATDRGRAVTDEPPKTSPCTQAIPLGAFVGEVTNTHVMARAPTHDGGIVDTGSFTLVDDVGKPLKTGDRLICGITLGGRTPATDPLYDARHATTGGGDTGSVLISPYITPGTKSKVFYNHYSWLRTMEDLFNVAQACGQPACQGLDGKGHLGYAAQDGLAPFGTDVFTNPTGRPRRIAFSPARRPRPASAAHPALAIEGDTITVRLAHGAALATVVGPRLPAANHAGGRSSLLCTFTVTVTALSAPVAIAATQFTAVDEYGVLHRLQVAHAKHQSKRRRLAAGHTTRLTMTTSLPPGTGNIAWSPTGTATSVSWNFAIEPN